MCAVSDFVRQISDEVSELAMKERKNLMDSIHEHPSPNVKNAEKLSDFISQVENKDHCLREGDFMFLFFDNVDDYKVRFGEDTTISVLGSRPGLYIYGSENEKRGGVRRGEAERLHERMESHCKEYSNIKKRILNKDYIGENPGVVILKCAGIRDDDEFNVHEMRKLGEILVNDFLEQAGAKFDTKGRPRVYVSKDGCEQAKDLIKALQKAVHHSLFKKIVGSAKTVNLRDFFSDRGV